MGVTTLFIEVANIAKPDARERLSFPLIRAPCTRSFPLRCCVG